MRILFSVAIVVAATAGAAPAWAQDAEPAFTVSGNVGVVSDYRFRGVSQTGRDPALQGGIDLAAASGWFAGGWASTIDDYGGADVEVDLYAGYGASAGGIDLTFTGLAYLYPGGEDVNYFELQGEAAHSIGPARISAQLAYSPDQDNLGGDNLYLGTGVEVGLPQTPLTLRARLGYEDGSYDGKLDWEIGADYVAGPLTLSLAYVDTDHSAADEAGRAAKAGLLASVRADF